MIEIQAYKMDGLGNDFIIIDRRKDKIDLSKQQIINIADRKNGPGCDQIIIIDKDKQKKYRSKSLGKRSWFNTSLRHSRLRYCCCCK